LDLYFEFQLFQFHVIDIVLLVPEMNGWWVAVLFYKIIGPSVFLNIYWSWNYNMLHVTAIILLIPNINGSKIFFLKKWGVLRI
jgi:hypothetical protein